MSTSTEQMELEFDLKKFNNRKVQLKAELKRFHEFLSAPDLHKSIELLQARYEAAKPLLDRFKLVQTEFEELLLADGSNYDEKELAEERNEFENQYFQAIATSHKILNGYFCNGSQEPLSSGYGAGLAMAGPSMSSHSASTSVPAGGQPSGYAVLPNISAKLPLLTLPQFTGSYGDWQRFHDMFLALVHNNSSLTDVQRFYYLEASLKGEPKNIIASLAPTDANYSTAWELLKKRYENKKIIINAHLRDIMDLPALSKESHVSLRQFSNTFLKNYRSLEAMGENVHEWNTILIYILVSKLDNNSKREWETFSQDISSPKIDDFNNFLTKRCQLLESVDSKASFKRPFEQKTCLASASGVENRPKCPYCKEQHFIYYCEKFKQLSVSNRFDKVKQMNLCSNCLRYGHKTAACRTSGCKICQQKHSTLLHRSQETSSNRGKESSEIPVKSTMPNGNDKSHSENDSPSNRTFMVNTENPSETVKSDCNNLTMSMSNTCENSSSYILLSTAIVNAYDSHKNIVPCRVLLDSASQSNFVTSAMFKKLNLQSTKVDLPVVGINQTKTNIFNRTTISIASQHTGFKTKLNFFVLPTITDLAPQIHFDAERLQIPKELPLADSDFNIPTEVDMLLGCEIFFELLCIGQIKLGKNLPIVQKTLLGWVITGHIPCGGGKIGKSDFSLVNCLFSQDTLNKDLERFWLLEEIDINPHSKMSQEEIYCENYFRQTTTRDENGRFIVKLPLKSNFTELGDSEQTALYRLNSIERRLSKNPKLDELYKSFMREYQILGHMTEISRNLPSKTPVYYIPHHCVEKPDSTTTKLRVVFDAACKTTNKLSLNNVLKVGPTVQQDLFSILLRFRQHNVVLVGDLAKMYRQVLIDQDERNLQRIIWRDSPQGEVKHFQLNTVTYGTASASFLATRCLLQISSDVAETLPVESQIIANDFYVDDLLTGAPDVESLIQIQLSICKILSSYGFELRKFQSNSQVLLNSINLNSSLDNKYTITDNTSIKTLGISWVPNLDIFEYNSLNMSDFEHDSVTKRTILSFISKIFDPLGLLSPLTIRTKLLIQKLWQLKVDWDESIPNHLYSEWQILRGEISQVGLMQIPRHVLVPCPKIIEIHGFSDASEKAYACCIYMRSINSDNIIESRLICAKSRVSPLKSVTLPRLELLGAVLLARLISKCEGTLNLDINRICLWTDSTIVLSWIANEPKTWKTFIANRVAEIQRLTKIECWNHIQSEKNPADIISRGASLKTLIHSNLWLHGPDFLTEPSKWPKNSNISCFTRSSSNIPELKTIPKLTLILQNLTIDLFERFSCVNKLIRIVAYCLRFIKNIKSSIETRVSGNLSFAEIQQSELILIKIVQSQAFSMEYHDIKTKNCVSSKSKLKSLSPFIDENHVIRVGGRLGKSTIPFEVKHPIILPSKHIFTRLIIEREHKRTLHSGVHGTLSHVRQRYWPLNGKQLVKACIRRCIPCFKARPPGIPYPKMGELPQSRITPSRPFLFVNADYAGPFNLKEGKTRSNKLIKGYVCIFVCQSTKAVHIEVITDLTSNGFLSLLKRFVSRRGICSDIYTDNATNFVGCNNELISIQKLISSSNINDYVIHSNIKWHFMPAKSPHFGGLHEAAVKSCKHHLKRVLEGINLNYEEFYTLTTQIEAILNSRPLVPISSDPNDLSALTPAHFLIGHELTAIPERDITNDKINYVKRYRHLQLMGQHFWARWRKEYLHHLQQRSKWQASCDSSPQVGDMVLMQEDNVPPMFWPLGRVVEVHPGKDGIVRVVSVKTKGGVFKRAVTKIALLPVN